MKIFLVILISIVTPPSILFSSEQPTTAMTEIVKQGLEQLQLQAAAAHLIETINRVSKSGLKPDETLETIIANMKKILPEGVNHVISDTKNQTFLTLLLLHGNEALATQLLEKQENLKIDTQTVRTGMYYCRECLKPLLALAKQNTFVLTELLSEALESFEHNTRYEANFVDTKTALILLEAGAHPFLKATRFNYRRQAKEGNWDPIFRKYRDNFCETSTPWQTLERQFKNPAVIHKNPLKELQTAFIAQLAQNPELAVTVPRETHSVNFDKLITIPDSVAQEVVKIRESHRLKGES